MIKDLFCHRFIADALIVIANVSCCAALVVTLIIDSEDSVRQDGLKQSNDKGVSINVSKTEAVSGVQKFKKSITTSCLPAN